MIATEKLPAIAPYKGTSVSILDQGQVITLDYGKMIHEHKSVLWWGTAVGFRGMQAAAVGMSKNGLWSRENLSAVSGHPGRGILDAVNYVTHCVELDRCLVMGDPNCTGTCNSAMKYEWWISNNEKTVHVKLRQDFVPIEFYEMTDRFAYKRESEDDQRLFNLFKIELSAKIWNEPLEESFFIELLPVPLKPGEVPPDELQSLANSFNVAAN